MKVVRQPRKLGLLLCLLILAAPSLGQIKNDKKLAPIPPQLRERFVERMNLYFELKRTRQYDKLYELLSEAYSSITKRKPSREDFIKNYQERDAQGRNTIPIKWKLTKIIKALDNRGNETYFIFADTKNQYGGRNEAHFEVRVENGDWYFREYSVNI